VGIMLVVGAQVLQLMSALPTNVQMGPAIQQEQVPCPGAITAVPCWTQPSAPTASEVDALKAQAAMARQQEATLQRNLQAIQAQAQAAAQVTEEAKKAEQNLLTKAKQLTELRRKQEFNAALAQATWQTQINSLEQRLQQSRLHYALEHQEHQVAEAWAHKTEKALFEQAVANRKGEKAMVNSEDSFNMGSQAQFAADKKTMAALKAELAKANKATARANAVAEPLVNMAVKAGVRAGNVARTLPPNSQAAKAVAETMSNLNQQVKLMSFLKAKSQ